MADQLYLRYYSGHVGSYGHEFIEFEITGNRLRFALNTKSVPISRLAPARLHLD